MNTKVHLIGIDQETSIRYSRVIREQGISRIEISENTDLAHMGLEKDSGVAFLGYDSGKQSCKDLLDILRSNYPQVSIVLITSSSDLRTVVDALKFGALDHVVKGEWDEDHIVAAVQRIIRMKDLLNADKSELWKQISSRIHAA